jgi:hypothetical protein
MDLEATSSAHPPQITIELAAPRRNPPQTIRIHLRQAQRAETVMLNDQPVSTFDAPKSILTLPGSFGRARIAISW